MRLYVDANKAAAIASSSPDIDHTLTDMAGTGTVGFHCVASANPVTHTLGQVTLAYD